ncbi:MAG: glycosyltransferase family 2 protein [Sideroxyarcus sp.]|nr:glycosyltransferase family 2 protein [Sideroxyarcus sp.]
MALLVLPTIIFGNFTLDISVILVSYNTIEMTKMALSHLDASSHEIEMEVIIVDNDSKDHSAEVLRSEYPQITLIENKKNVGFGRANNQALPQINGRYVLLLNTDAFVQPDTIEKTIRYMDENPQCGILGVKLLGRDGALQPSCRYFPTPWNIFLKRTGLKRFFQRAVMVDDMSWDHDSVRECDWVPGCYYLIRKEVIDQVGLMDPRYFLYYEEIDHCFAAKRAGWQVTYFPYSSVVHIGGESAKSEGEITSSGRQIESLKIESELLYFYKNHGVSTVVADVFLSTLADGIQMLKDTVKLRRPRWILAHFDHSILMWKCFFRTRMGKQPTR